MRKFEDYSPKVQESALEIAEILAEARGENYKPLPTYEDCLLKVAPRWVTTQKGEPIVFSECFPHRLENCQDHLPTEKDALQIASLIKEVVVAAYINSGMEFKNYGGDLYHIECEGGVVKPHCFMMHRSTGPRFQTEADCQRAIDILTQDPDWAKHRFRL